MKRFTLPLALVLVLGLGGCYTATVNTGKQPSPMVIEKNWASAWLGGLIPPAELNAAQACSSGVAQVRTSLSFLNQLVSGLTWGIYTPMTIRVVCAAAEAIQSETSLEWAVDEADATRRLESGGAFLLSLH